MKISGQFILLHEFDPRIHYSTLKTEIDVIGSSWLLDLMNSFILSTSD